MVRRYHEPTNCGTTATRTAPHRAHTGWERYAQRPLNWLVTSSVFGDHPEDNGQYAALANQTGDWAPDVPLPRQRLTVAPTARVYEITGTEEWHALCVRFPLPKARLPTTCRKAWP
ncbi:hypothetical protein GCM10022402_12720 [Salinactinospora qingdaonensis]|uniref:Uncharacterized protein n=1 Tax=Salinactinospora qingdaonensis TaxID=702744 RepID=A0ABP7F8P2_9ACTN